MEKDPSPTEKRNARRNGPKGDTRSYRKCLLTERNALAAQSETANCVTVAEDALPAKLADVLRVIGRPESANTNCKKMR